MLFLVVLQAAIFGYSQAASSCPEPYNSISAAANVTHSICRHDNIATQFGLTSAEKTEIVKKHNTIRGHVNPPAANMMKMHWDDTLAKIAQGWASHCNWGHETNKYTRRDYKKYTVGQNIYRSSSKAGWDHAIQRWADEEQDFTFGKKRAAVVGHYTQIVWATSVRIGCGYANCGDHVNHYYVCNYGPGGNHNHQDPYVDAPNEAARGSQCKTKTNGLCDCGNKACYNGGTLDPKTCTCHCKDFHTGMAFSSTDCSMDCSKHFTESHSCGHKSGFTDCDGWNTNMPLYCPKMCKWCP